MDSVSIYRNLFMGNELITFSGFLDKRRMRKETKRVVNESISIGIRSVDQVVRDLSGGQKQAVAIARAIYFMAKLLLLDEPTNALSVRESKQVLSFVQDLRNKVISSIFVTHNLLHVYSIADRLVILSRGEKVGDYKKKDISIENLKHIIVTSRSIEHELDACTCNEGNVYSPSCYLSHNMLSQLVVQKPIKYLLVSFKMINTNFHFKVFLLFGIRILENQETICLNRLLWIKKR